MRRIGLIAVALGLLLALASVLSLGGRETAGDPTAIEANLTSPPTTMVSTTTTTVVESTTTTTQAEVAEPVPLWQDQINAGADSAIPAPTQLRIEKLEVDAPINPYGVDQRTGEMAVPRNVTEVAWYQYGPKPGEGGSAVLAAHVDLQSQGPGVFFNLRELEPGDEITVAYADGSESRFVVEARETYLKDELPTEAIFSRNGSPVLTLITCGGGFNSSLSSYDSNVVVYATPTPGQT